jgi:hypothetical protein
MYIPTCIFPFIFLILRNWKIRAQWCSRMLLRVSEWLALYVRSFMGTSRSTHISKTKPVAGLTFFTGKKELYYLEWDPERSSSRNWTMLSGPEPNQVRKQLSDHAKLARQWLILIWDRSILTNIQALPWEDKDLISLIKYIKDDLSCVEAFTASTSLEQSVSMIIGSILCNNACSSPSLQALSSASKGDSQLEGSNKMWTWDFQDHPVKPCPLQ